MDFKTKNISIFDLNHPNCTKWKKKGRLFTWIKMHFLCR
jgi:hypothetical protein